MKYNELKSVFDKIPKGFIDYEDIRHLWLTKEQATEFVDSWSPEQWDTARSYYSVRPKDIDFRDYVIWRLTGDAKRIYLIMSDFAVVRRSAQR